MYRRPLSTKRYISTKNKMKMKYIPLILLTFALVLALPVLPGCSGINSAPIAEGQDAVIVNAERIQRSSLDIYEQVIKWETVNRAVLPAEVSRAVDKFRAEFPKAWEQSRVALGQYKLGTGPDATTMGKATAALSIVQSSLLGLMLNGSDSEIAQAKNSLDSLIRSVGLLFN